MDTTVQNDLEIINEKINGLRPGKRQITSGLAKWWPVW